jgi:hypothetical protein
VIFVAVQQRVPQERRAIGAALVGGVYANDRQISVGLGRMIITHALEDAGHFLINTSRYKGAAEQAESIESLCGKERPLFSRACSGRKHRGPLRYLRFSSVDVSQAFGHTQSSDRQDILSSEFQRRF